MTEFCLKTMKKEHLDALFFGLNQNKDWVVLLKLHLKICYGYAQNLLG